MMSLLAPRRRRRVAVRAAVRVAALALAALTFTACDDSTGPDGSIYKIDMFAASPVLNVGQTTRVVASPTNAGGRLIEGRTITFSSSTPAVATVDGNGLVTALAGGTTTITATTGGESATLDIGVLYPTQTVTLAPAAGQSTTIRQEGSVQINATFTDATGATVTGRQVVWTSSSPAVATVNNSGFVAGVTDGTTTITATTLDGVAGTVVVTVSGAPVVATVTLAATSNRYIGQGQTEQMVATARAASGTVLSLAGRTVTWTSSATGVATVDANGLVSMVAASGTSNIGVSVDGIAATAVQVVGVNPIANAVATPIATLAVDGNLYYGFEVPAGTTNLQVTLAGGTGDADVLVYRPGLAPPTNPYASNSWTCISAAAGNGESCAVATPAAGRWLVRVYAYEAVAGTTLTVTRTP